MRYMSRKELDKALGIDSLDSFLSDLNVEDEAGKIREVDEKVRESVDRIDSQMEEYRKNGIQAVDVSNIGSSLGELRELIDVSKGTIRRIYDQLADSEMMIDSELVGSLSKLLEATHLTVSEYINLYRDRASFYDKVRLEMLKHEQKKELLERKHQMDLEKIDRKNEGQEVESENLIGFSQEDIVKTLQEQGL